MWTAIWAAVKAIFGIGAVEAEQAKTAADEKMGAIAQQQQDSTGVMKDVQTSNNAADAVNTGGRAAANSVLLADSRTN
jgi:hypothetical protein